jgi:sugar phosphate isomerase/epimerase
MSERKYKFGLSTTVDYTVALEKQMEIIAASGFEFISLGADVEHSRYFDSRAFGNSMKLAAQHSLKIVSAHVPFRNGYDIAAIDVGPARKAVKNVLNFLEWTNRYGIAAAIVHPHYYFDDGKEACLKRAANALEKIIHKRPAGVRVDIENLPDFRGSWICGHLLDLFGPCDLGFCYDSSHENMSGPPFHILQEYWKRITQTHLSDNNGTSDDHFIPGDGNINWPALRSYLEKNSDLTEILFEVGTGERLAEPFESFVRRASLAARQRFG